MKKIKIFLTLACLTLMATLFVSKVSAEEMTLGVMTTENSHVEISDAAEGGIAKVTYIGSGGTSAYLDVPVTNLTSSSASVYVSVKFSITEDMNVSGYGLNEMYIKHAGGTHVVASMKGGWNVTTEDYSEKHGFMIQTANISSYIDDIGLDVPITHVGLKIKGPVGCVFEVLQMAVTTTGAHGFEVPADFEIGDITTSATATITKNDAGHQAITYTTSPGWHTFKAAVKNAPAENNICQIKFAVSAPTYICFAFNGDYDNALGHQLFEAGEHVFIYDISVYNLPVSYEISLYLDAQVSVASEKTVTIYSIELLDSIPEEPVLEPSILVKLAFEYEEAEYSQIKLYANLANEQLGEKDAQYKIVFKANGNQVESPLFTLAGEGKEAAAIYVPNEHVGTEITIEIQNADSIVIGSRVVTVKEVAQDYISNYSEDAAVVAALAALQAMAQ